MSALGKRPFEALGGAGDFSEAKRTESAFRGLSRHDFMQQRVHRRLHPQAESLGDTELAQLGELSFNEQFPFIERLQQSSPNSWQSGGLSPNFGNLDRDSFISQRVHRKLHPRAASLSDQELAELGSKSFNEQFRLLGEDGLDAGTSRRPPPWGRSLFGDSSREEYMQQRVHRKLHAQAARLSDQKLFEIGQLSFNEQFHALEQSGPQEQRHREESRHLFGDLGREGFMQQRVHRRLHAQAASMSDSELFELGKLSFNDQFPIFENQPQSRGQDGQLFGELGRNGFIQQRVHRKLHAQAARFSDEELAELGKMSFNEQFTTLGEPGPQEQQQQQSLGSGNLFGAGGREAYMKERVHRKLHAEAAALTDEELFNLGKLSFNEQFPVLGQSGPREEQQQQMQHKPEPHLFGELGRDGYIRERIHRRLHTQIAKLNDHDLFEIGKLSFNEQFPAMGQAGPKQEQQQLQRQQEMHFFGEGGREGYMKERVHRRLHAQAATLSDRDLAELGKLKFNEQFPAMGLDGQGEQQQNSGSQRHFADTGGQDLFRGLSRREFMQQRVHRKLHSQAESLSEKDLAELGELSFNDQFMALEMAGVGKSSESRTDGPFRGQDRNSFLQQRVHRKLHSRASKLSDENLNELGLMSFNEQFPAIARMDGLGELS